jgi:hypothetical protein
MFQSATFHSTGNDSPMRARLPFILTDAYTQVAPVVLLLREVLGEEVGALEDGAWRVNEENCCGGTEEQLVYLGGPEDDTSCCCCWTSVSCVDSAPLPPNFAFQRCCSRFRISVCVDNCARLDSITVCNNGMDVSTPCGTNTCCTWLRIVPATEENCLEGQR